MMERVDFCSGQSGSECVEYSPLPISVVLSGFLMQLRTRFKSSFTVHVFVIANVSPSFVLFGRISINKAKLIQLCLVCLYVDLLNSIHPFHHLEPPNPLIRAIYTLPVVRCICKILNSTNIANWRCFLHMTEKYHTSKFVWYFILLT